MSDRRDGHGTPKPRDPPDFVQLRAAMVADQLEARGIRQPEVLDAMRRVPRELFVPRPLVARAYEDGALAIGGGQTISQPYMVARMTQALDLPGWARANPETASPPVLDVGTGSGYHAAVLATMGARVTSIDRDDDLATEARDRLERLGFTGIRVVVGDGSAGWEEGAPYAGVIVAAAAPDPPEPLIAQLADGGRLVIPVGDRDHQELRVIRRVGDRIDQQSLEPCVFVPLVGRYGFR